MSKFASKKIDAVKGKQTFKQLIIYDEKAKLKPADIEKQEGVLDIYENELEEAYSKSFLRILAVMNLVANLKGVSEEQMKVITPAKEDIVEYEFKAGDLRVYAIKISNGQLVILCGFKNSQKKDISHFRALKLQYINSLKTDK